VHGVEGLIGGLTAFVLSIILIWSYIRGRKGRRRGRRHGRRRRAGGTSVIVTVDVDNSAPSSASTMPSPSAPSSDSSDGSDGCNCC
jgi:hypothetical protein